MKIPKSLKGIKTNVVGVSGYLTGLAGSKRPLNDEDRFIITRAAIYLAALGEHLYELEGIELKLPIDDLKKSSARLRALVRAATKQPSSKLRKKRNAK